MDCQIQSGGCDCGLFAITNATALVLGDDPNKLFFDHAGENETTPLPVPGKRMLATFPCKEKKTNSEESGDCVLLRRLLHLQNARNGRGREVGRMHQVLEMVPPGQMSEHFSRILRR